MTNHDHRAPLDLVSIERQARIMQSQAMAAGFRSMVGWLRARLSGSGTTGAAPTT